MMRSGLLLCLFLMAMTPKVFAQQIIFEGLSPQDQEQLFKNTPELQSAPTPAALDNAIRFLMLQETYSTVSVDKSGNQYRLIAVPLRKIAEVKISGNEKVDSDSIMNALGLKAGSRFDSGRILVAGERLKEFYGQRGFFNAIVSFDFQDLPNNEIKVFVQVKEREPCIIEEVQFLSENADINERLTKSVKKYMDENFTEQAILNIEDVANTLLRDKRFLNSQLIQKEVRYNNSKTRAVLIYELTDPYSYQVLFNGNQFYTPNHLLGQLNLDSYYRSGKDAAPQIAQMIYNHYISTGFPLAKVTYRLKEIKTSFIKQVTVEIQEGERTKIRHFEVSGRISRPSDYYTKFIRKNSSPMVAKGFYVRSDIENGLKNLTIELNNQGYLKAKVHSLRSEFNDKKNQIDLTVIMDEGPLTQLNKVTFYGLRAFKEEELLEALPIQPQTPLRLNDLEESVRILKKYYTDRGYLEVKLLSEDASIIEYDEKGLNANVTFKIEEGPPIYIRRIVVEGNVFTKDYVPIWESELQIGELLTPTKIEEAQKRIENLQIFSRVGIRTLEENTGISERTVVISVSEQNPGLFRMGAGLTNKRVLTGRGFAGISYNNLWGTARKVSTRITLENNLVESDPLEYEVNVAYLEPFLFGSRFRGRSSYTRSEKLFDEVTLLATDSFLLSVERDITSKIKFSWLAYGYDSVEESSVSEAGQKRRKSRQDIAYVGPSIDIDYRDNPFLPTKGVYFKWDTEYAAPELGSSRLIEFVRTQSNLTHYLRLGTPKVVWANSVRSGYVKNLNELDGAGVPLSFSFFLGGMTTIRGYSGSENDRIPSKELLNITDRNQLVVPSESHYYLGKSEVRFPIRSPLGGAVFWDGGEVRLSHLKMYDNFKQSYGVGVHINTPVGPIKLEYARKIEPSVEESPDQWHLSIGTF